MKARRYKNAKQFTKEELRILKKRKQPAVVYNRVRKKVNGLLGYQISQRTDPVAYGRTEQDMAAAATATKVMRFIEENTKTDSLITGAFENMAVEGTGALEITVKPEEPDYEVAVRRIPWEMLYYDPRAREADFSDASFLGVSEWMHLDEAKTRYPNPIDKDALVANESDHFDEDESVDDRPRILWFDRRQRRIRVVQHWRIEGGDWYYYTFTGSGYVEKGKSPYEDDKGNTVCPIRAMSCYIDDENCRYGIVRDLFGPQDEINHRRSKLLHKISEKQFFYRTGALDNPEKIRQELRRPDGVIEVNHGEFNKDFGVITDTSGLQGQAELLAEAKAEIDAQGLNPTLLGRGQGNASGRAILATQQGAIAEEAIIFERLRDFQLDIYRSIWHRVKQFYRAERVIRITDDKRSPEYIGLNQQVGQTLEGRPIVSNPVAAMNVDLMIEQTQDSPTLQAEEFEKIVGLIETVPGFANEVDIVDILKSSSLTSKHEWIEKIEKKREAAAQQPPDPVQQAAVQAQMQTVAAEIDETKASADLKRAQRQKVLVDAGKAEVEARFIPFQAVQQALPTPQPQQRQPQLV